MKAIILMRHAQAETAPPDMKDFDRELTLKGREDSKKMAEYLKKHFEPIDAIFTSNAKRTSATAAIVNEEGGAFLKAVPEFYHADPGLFSGFIKTVDEQYKVIMIVGHNPAISLYAGLLAKTGIDMKPSDVVIFKVADKPWTEKPEVVGLFHKSVH